MKKSSISILIIVIIGALAFFALTIFVPKDPYEKALHGGETSTETILIKNGQVIETDTASEEVAVAEPSQIENTMTDTEPETNNQKLEIKKEVMVTNGIRHSVPLDEIVGGGPAKDGIPSIDNPKFVGVNQASDYLTDEEVGIALSYQGENRFYPFQILVVHEIVNDQIDGQRVLVTYCPLCFSGVVFDPLVKNDRVEFGTSGKLWQSNLVMYDRSTDSYWSQILGEAIVGEMTGTKLKIISSDIMKYGEWKKLNPSGQVLSQDTGVYKSYGFDPYGSRGYYTDNNLLYSTVGSTDDRLKNKDLILGIEINGQAKAYYPPSVKEKGEVEDRFADKTIVAKYSKDLDVVQLFEKQAGGNLERVDAIPTFWFSWVGAHPDTKLYK